MSLTHTTKLDAINVLLASIGEAPVSQEGTGLEEAALASSVLTEVSRTVQLRGWAWNTEHNFPLKRDLNNLIFLPSNALKADFQCTHIIARGLKVYDKSNHSYTFSNDLTVTLTLGLEWDELSEAVRSFITYRAGRIFQTRQVSSSLLHEFTKIDEQLAWNELIAAELEVNNVSIFDNAELSLMLDRSSSTPVYDYQAGSVGGLIR